MNTFRELIQQSAEKYGAMRAFTLKTEAHQYQDISYIRWAEEVRTLATALLANGYGGERIAIIGKNSYHWFLVHAAALMAGCISVPLDKELKYGEFEQSVRRSQASVIFYDQKQAPMTDALMISGNSKLQTAYALNDASSERSVDALLAEGKRRINEGDSSLDHVEIDPDALAMLIFTSGTTSQSKIVMLSQRNVCSNVTGMLGAEPILPSDTNMALLPYHHMFGSTGQWVMLSHGVRTVYCDGLKYIQKNMKEYRVSVFVGVPLIIEQMYKKILKTAEREGMAGRMRRASILVRMLTKMRIDVRRRMFHGVLEAFGGALRLVVLGSSAADPACIQGFNDFGILCVQGYGLTETSPVLTAERPGKQRMGSVGMPMKGVELQIANPDENGVGEVIARSEGVMLGYYDNPEATSAVLRNGWFHTGDLGYIDAQGYLFLTGRKKNVIVLKSGKNVFPEELEKRIQELPYELENIVVGLPKEGDENDLAVAVVIVYDEAYFVGVDRSAIEQHIRENIDAINDTLPGYKRIHRIFLQTEPMVKTTTGKIRRFMVREKLIPQEETIK